ncbi:hypothetical protein H2200_002413 [Cladophialophora chaetospira]|uniref:Uncharacterized protein n=1 Tax=Cladophialophora chaetospira TaxID=386627 RepID=A0AA38XIV6_9EURO|nr:hypothetical protein H2200_002413 [Cladophialophora chaetospira]
MTSMRLFNGLWLLFVLLSTYSHWSNAALPHFEPSMTPQEAALVSSAFFDGIGLARTAAVLFGCSARDPYFNRYFAEADSAFVKHMFRTLAAVPLDFDATGVDINDLLAYLQGLSADTLNDNFDQLSISYGTHPAVPQQARQDNGLDCTIDPELTGFMWRSAPDPTNYLSLCPLIFTTFYSISDTLHPPPTLNGVPGLTCDGLGDHETDYMETPGLTVLHELMHWPALFRNVPDYATKIRPTRPGQLPLIGDYSNPGGNPSNGYGPFRTHLVRDLPDVNGFSESLNNADNYAWYATLKMWSFYCDGKYFGPATSDADFRRREPP